MMVQGQLGQSQQTTMLLQIPAAEKVRIGLLGNETIQVPAKTADPHGLLAAYRKLLASAQPAFKLALLKRQKFTPDRRPERIAASLTAVSALQPTDLSLAQWKEIVEQIDDEE